jgi:hypothetical protein
MPQLLHTLTEYVHIKTAAAAKLFQERDEKEAAATTGPQYDADKHNS